ncbi:MAG TPA: 3D domain-containing protein [Methylomusa anaerophila]|uniref:3D domain protein n=1 Tax=Methylomusa anaerophila TaxID=1930071 RepID=A0A348AND9_9FIRM|nr:3D domain-containing protein [Methylomusa anaerophila]BBB92587.1 3D domain protein [Methylomusa anaerophila]HML87558.1 3D domain-containing protein [Methylomusa anaerophila]
MRLKLNKLTIGTIIIVLMLSVGINYKIAIDQEQADEARIAQLTSEAQVNQQMVEKMQKDIAILRRELAVQREVYPTSRGGRRVVHYIDGAQVTWYNDKGKTASGTTATAGRTVAVDPDVVPLGAEVEIVMPDGRVFRRTAEDTGGAVKGKVFDVHIDASDEELYELGRTHGVRVFVLDR